MDQNGKDDLKTQFMTREGTYRLITLSEYSRPNRVGYQSNQNNPQVRVSLITLPATDAVANAATPSIATAVTATATAAATSNSTAENAKYLPHQSSSTTTTANAAISLNGSADAPLLHTTQLSQQQQGVSDRICFNFGKELYVYSYRGVKKVSLLPANGRMHDQFFILCFEMFSECGLVQAHR